MGHKRKIFQKAIVDNYMANNSTLLKKYPICSIGVSLFEPVIVSACYGLSGLSNQNEHNFLPDFEFEVIARYSISIPDKTISGLIEHSNDGIKMELKSNDNSRIIPVSFPNFKDLFFIRNLALEGKLMAILSVNEQDRTTIPIETNQVKSGFYFMAYSTTFGKLDATMKTDQQYAEDLISQYLQKICIGFENYRELEHPFQKKDEQNYNYRRDKLHHALFGDLKKVFEQGCLEYRLHSE